MWDFTGGRPDHHRFLVLGFTLHSVADAPALPLSDELIVSGPLLSDDGAFVLGAAVLLEARDEAGARRILPAEQYVGVEVHQ